ncbi:MAG: precorrin-2 dehydrogenase/sirohydrochlorin ferrochelatase family protein [Actinomycetota bacterium]
MLDANLYIACLVLTGRRVLVVGAGRIGLEKIEGLLACGADITVVAPEAVAEIEVLDASDEIEWHPRVYETSDLDGKLLVVAATSDTELNTRVHNDAEARTMLVNVVDVPELCNFILPAIVREGPLAVAISTSGASPALAKRMKREIAANIGPEYAELAQLLDGVRDWAKKTLPTYDDRKEFFEDIVNGDPDPIERLRTGNRDEVKDLIRAAQMRHG